MANVLVFFLVLAACCTYAFWRGGTPERIGAAIFIVVTILTGLAASSARPSFASMEAGILLVDTGMLFAFLLLALFSRRYWPLWMTGLQAVQVAVHAAQMASPEMMPWVYAVAQGIWSYPMMAILILGTWRHRRRLKLYGADEPWLSSSTTSPRSGRGSGRQS